MSRPAVSVIVPVHNTAEWLERCLESLKQQTLESLEIILVDDASEDGSDRICRQYSEKYPAVFKFAQTDTHRGPGVARNLGLEQARGEYVGFVDSDDYVELGMFGLLYQTACENASDLVLCGYCEVAGEARRAYVPGDMSIDELAFDRHWHSSLCNKLFRRKLLDSYGIRVPESSFAEDMAFVAKVLMLNPRFNVVGKPLYYYCKRETSLTFTLKNRQDVFVSLKDMFGFGRHIGFSEKQKRACKMHAFYQGIYHPACLVLVDALLKGQNRAANFRDVPGYLKRLIQYLTSGR